MINKFCEKYNINQSSFFIGLIIGNFFGSIVIFIIALLCIRFGII